MTLACKVPYSPPVPILISISQISQYGAVHGDNGCVLFSLFFELVIAMEESSPLHLHQIKNRGKLN